MHRLAHRFAFRLVSRTRIGARRDLARIAAGSHATLRQPRRTRDFLRFLLLYPDSAILIVGAPSPIRASPRVCIAQFPIVATDRTDEFPASIPIGFRSLTFEINPRHMLILWRGILRATPLTPLAILGTGGLCEQIALREDSQSDSSGDCKGEGADRNDAAGSFHVYLYERIFNIIALFV